MISGLRDWFAQTNGRHVAPRIPVMLNMTSTSVSSRKNKKLQESFGQAPPLADETNTAGRNSILVDEDSDEDDEYQFAEPDQEVCSRGGHFVCFVSYLLIKVLIIAM